jgi:glycosyltransferase involved in cell wall biosynthesis
MKVALFANTDWYLYNFRLPLALRLKAQGYQVLLLSPPGDYGPRLRSQGLDWRPVPLRRRGLNPFSELAFVIGLARLLRAERPDLLHNFTFKSAIYGSLAGRLAGVRNRINAVTGLGYVFTSFDPKARLLRPLVRLMASVALRGRRARVILQNGDDAALFDRFGLARAAAVRLIRGSGVDCSRFTPPEGQRADGPLRVLLAARLLKDKGVLEYVEAARRLRAQGRRISFLLAGEPDDGNPAALSAAEVRGFASEGTVEWLGHVDDMPARGRTAGGRHRRARRRPGAARAAGPGGAGQGAGAVRPGGGAQEDACGLPRASGRPGGGGAGLIRRSSNHTGAKLSRCGTGTGAGTSASSCAGQPAGTVNAAELTPQSVRPGRGPTPPSSALSPTQRSRQRIGAAPASSLRLSRLST